MYEYRIENNKYSLYNNNKLIFKDKEEISLLFSKELLKEKEEFILHKHGLKENVECFFEKNHHFFNIIGSELFLIKGRFPINELNKLISTTGYAKIFIHKFKKNEIIAID